MTLHREEDESILDFRIRQIRSEAEVACRHRDWPDFCNLMRQLEQLNEDKRNGRT